MPRLDEEPDWEDLDNDERQLLRRLAAELGMVFVDEEDDLDDLTYE